MKKITLLFACFLAITHTISAQCTFKIAVDTVIHPVCFGQNGGAIFLKTTNAQLPVSYNWGANNNYSSMNNLAAGKYSVTATDNRGCRDSILNIQIRQADTPFITFVGLKPTTPTMVTRAIFAIRRGAVTDTVDVPINGTGTQNVRLTDRFGCSYLHRVTIVLNPSNDLADGSEKFYIHQNASKNVQVLITLDEENDCQLNVFTINGQLVHNQSFRTKESAFFVKDLPSGLLLFSLEFKDKIIIKKVVLMD